MCVWYGLSTAPSNFLQELLILFFHSWIKPTFLVSESLLCLYKEQNNTWLLVNTGVWNFSSRVQLNISLVLCTHLWTVNVLSWPLEEKFHVFLRPWIIPYLTRLWSKKSILYRKEGDHDYNFVSNFIIRIVQMKQRRKVKNF